MFTTKTFERNDIVEKLDADPADFLLTRKGYPRMKGTYELQTKIRPGTRGRVLAQEGVAVIVRWRGDKRKILTGSHEGSVRKISVLERIAEEL